jgi:hypothetical protein
LEEAYPIPAKRANSTDAVRSDLRYWHRGDGDTSVTKTALVTLAIGRDYSERFENYCRAGWTAYAERHGFDIFVFKEPLDTSARARRRSPAWQKCLVLGAPEAAGYERLVWVDADICINPAAPSILDARSWRRRRNRAAWTSVFGGRGSSRAHGTPIWACRRVKRISCKPA